MKDWSGRSVFLFFNNVIREIFNRTLKEDSDGDINLEGEEEIMYLGSPYERDQKNSSVLINKDWERQWPSRCQNQKCKAKLVEETVIVKVDREEIPIKIKKCPKGCEN